MEPGSATMRLVIVTGASRGIGLATSLALVREHRCHVIAVSRDAVALKAIAKASENAEGVFEAFPLDITDRDAPEILKDHIRGRRLHALINNAGVLLKRSFGNWTAEDLQLLFRTNVFAPVRLLQTLADALGGDPPGHVVNIGSMGGFQGSSKFPGLLGYSASKAALSNMTECMAEELSGTGVHCNCLCIGAVDTGMFRAAFPGLTAPVEVDAVGSFIARFALEGQYLFNGKVLPVAMSTP